MVGLTIMAVMLVGDYHDDVGGCDKSRPYETFREGLKIP